VWGGGFEKEGGELDKYHASSFSLQKDFIGTSTYKLKGDQMKWETHRRITKFAWRKLNLPERWTGSVAEASLLPDRVPDKTLKVGSSGKVYEGRVPHHEPNPDLIMKHIWKARLSLLKRDRIQFVKSLGYALHYIQDGMVSMNKKFLFFSYKSYEAHEKIEEDLRLVPLPSNAKLIEKCTKTVIKTPQQLERVIQKVSPREDIENIMLLASVYTLVTIGAIVNGNKFPESYKRNYLHYADRHAKFLLASTLISLVITLPLIYFSSILFVFFPFIVIYSIHKLDFSYSRSAKIAEWYGEKKSILKFLMRSPIRI